MYGAPLDGYTPNNWRRTSGTCRYKPPARAALNEITSGSHQPYGSMRYTLSTFSLTIAQWPPTLTSPWRLRVISLGHCRPKFHGKRFRSLSGMQPPNPSTTLRRAWILLNSTASSPSTLRTQLAHTTTMDPVVDFLVAAKDVVSGLPHRHDIPRRHPVGQADPARLNWPMTFLGKPFFDGIANFADYSPSFTQLGRPVKPPQRSSTGLNYGLPSGEQVVSTPTSHPGGVSRITPDTLANSR